MRYKRKLIEILLRSLEIFVFCPLSLVFARILFFIWGASVGKDLSVRGTLRLRLMGTLSIGDNVKLFSGYSNYVGASSPIAIKVLPDGCLKIGDDCGISNSTIICSQSINILPGTFIGGGCKIYDTDFHQLDPTARAANQGEIGVSPINIGPRAFIGAHSTILKGVSIGEGSVIGAGSLVSRDIPPFEVWGGVPVKKLRSLLESR